MTKSKNKKDNHSQRAHAILGASSSHIWLNCPGAPNLWKQIPKKKDSSFFAEEGTAAHELAEKVLTDTPNAFWYVGKQKFNDFDVTEEMAEHVQVFCDYVIEARNKCDGELFVEEKFDLGWIYPGMFGTNDAMIYDDLGGELEVIDFKYGAGVPVEVEENSQLIYYALGGARGRDVDKIKLTVVQPRCDHKDGPIRSWTMDKGHLMDWAKRLKTGAVATTKKDAPLNPGGQCRFCDAAGCCPALAKQAGEIARADFMDAKPKLPAVETLSNEQVSRIVEHKSMIESFLKEVQNYARERLIAGEAIEGLKLVKGRGRRTWHPERGSEEKLVQVLGDDIYDKKVLSPAQAEKRFGKDTVKDLWVSIDGSITVAHESDRRKAINPSPKDDFAEIETITEDMF